MQHFSDTMKDGAPSAILYSQGNQKVTRFLNGRIDQALSRPEIPAQTILDGMEIDLRRWLNRTRERTTS